MSGELKLELTAGYHGLELAEDALTETRCRLEVAKLEWDLMRYTVRLLEAERVPIAA